MKRITVLLFFVVAPYWGAAQSSCDIKSQLLQVEDLNIAGEFEKALAKTDNLLTCTSISEMEVVKISIAQYKLHRNTLRNRKASTALLKAITILHRKGESPDLDTKLLLAESYALRGDAKNFENSIKSIEDTILQPSFTNDYYTGRYHLIKHYGMDGDAFPVERVSHLQKALQLFEKSNEVPVYYLGNALRALGNLNRSEGDFDRSASYYLRELALYGAHYKPEHFNISICNYNLGGVYYEKLEYQKALDHFLAAHKVWVNTYEPGNYRMRSLNEAIGDMYWELNDMENALTYFNYAVTDEEAINNDTSEHTLTQADSLFEKGNYATAINYYEKAVKWRENTYGKEHMLTGACKNFVARALRSSGDIRASLDEYQEVINILVAEMSGTSWYENPTMDMKIQSYQYLLEALTAKGELLKELYTETNDRKDLEAALNTQETAIQLLEKIKNNYMSEASRFFWTSHTISLIEESIDTASKLYEITNDTGYIEKAFNFSERSKSLLLLASLYDHENTAFANVPAELLAEEKRLKNAITEYSGRIKSEEKRCAQVRDKMLKLYKDKLQSLQNEYDLLVTTIKTDHKEYYELKYDSQIASVQEIRDQLLTDNTSLTAYFSGKKSIVVFYISEEDIRMRTIENASEVFEEAIRFFSETSEQQQIQNRPQEAYENYKRLAFSLYKKLLQPELISEKQKRLIIIPDGNLSYLPFEALLTEDTGNSKRDYSTLPYLLNDRAVSYVPSASIALLNQAPKKAFTKYFGFAPSYEGQEYTDTRKKLANLRYNQPEVIFATELFNGKSWTGSRVTEDLLKNNSSTAGILHLAMHGEVEDEHPLLSKLYFNVSEEDDGMLHTYEIYNMMIPAQLVLLSACNTAKGKLIRGEGILSLERAFQYAGSRSLLSTLWTVDDEASSQLTQLFLENIKEGKTKDIALQHAKLEYLKIAKPEALHPFYWSSFKLTGNTKALENNSKKAYFYIAMGIILLGLGIFRYSRKNKKAA